MQLNYSVNGTVYGVQSAKLTIVRPPVVLVHGFNTDSSAWNTFTPFIDSTQIYSIFKINYGWPLYHRSCSQTMTIISCSYVPDVTVNGILLDIKSTEPEITVGSALARQSHLGFSFNSASVGTDILKAIGDFSLGANPLNIAVASIRADIVAHSMGGLVVRYWSASPVFAMPTTYNGGPVHKLITLGTPHFGTPQAILSLLPSTSCSRDLAAAKASLFFDYATLKNNVKLPGAASELSGDGIGVNLSVPLQLIKTHGFSFPMATLAGDVSSIESNLNSALPSKAVFDVCGALKDPLALRYNSTLFDSSFDPDITSTNPLGGAGGRHSDGNVPVSSAMNNPLITNLSQCPIGSCFTGYVHSSGIALFFGPGSNYLQDSTAVVAKRVTELLNTSVKMSIFDGNR